MTHYIPAAPSRRDIDLAVGILVGLLGYSERQAFDELVQVVYRTGGGISDVARSLIAVAGGRHEDAPYRAEALEIWGDAVHSRNAVTRPDVLIGRRAS